MVTSLKYLPVLSMETLLSIISSELGSPFMPSESVLLTFSLKKVTNHKPSVHIMMTAFQHNTVKDIIEE